MTNSIYLMDILNYAIESGLDSEFVGKMKSQYVAAIDHAKRTAIQKEIINNASIMMTHSISNFLRLEIHKNDNEETK